MAEIVGAFAASHTPLFLLRHDAPAEEVREEVFSSYRRMASEIVARGAEAMVLLGNDHLHAFSMDRYPALAIGVGPRFGPVETEPFLPGDVYEGAEALASHLTRGLLANGFDPLLCRELALDHSFVSPLALMGDTGLPVVPVLQNTVAPPLPPAARAYDLGVSLRRLLEGYEGHERVAVVATGAPSHWIGTPELGAIDEAWDREVIDMLCRADAKALSAWPQEKIDEGGNGGNEIRTWISAAALSGDTEANLWTYRIEPLWFLGVTVIEWPIGPAL